MFNQELINNDIKKVLSKERYIHCLGTMKKAEELAIKFGIDVEKAKIVGLAHDIAKEMSNEEKLKYIKDNNLEIDEIERNCPGLLHSKIGADICKKKYGFTKDMENAIKYHTVGNPEMDNLAKVLFVADKTEENRKSENLEYLDKVKDKNLDEAILYMIEIFIIEDIKKGKLIHPNGLLTRNKLLIK